MFLVDSHCHLNLLGLESQQEIANVIARAEKSGVRFFLNVCVDLLGFPAVLKTAEAFPSVAASVGLHPNEQAETIDTDTLMKLAQHKKVVAIGETGLDYYRSTGDLHWQHERFRMHIRVAKALQLPLIVHTRAAKEDTLRIMREENAEDVGGVMHCFSEDWETAKAALDLNFYISLSGVVTFKNAITTQLVAKEVPIDRLLIETDSPYLAPHPHRGKPNEPAYISLTAAYMASLRNMALDDFAVHTTNNFFTLFKGAVRPYV
ncbi:MAG: hypothetical protein A3F14_01105 [Gammaproteobacteria bacterium RIFCSPHIGHO2_12_FULL_43_28]|nr:MAG: hypothetical protein A3F14_01105 [Gammaproteobacteria bacterium RIFCSPHIGHO2_12_FULL_43_28]